MNGIWLSQAQLEQWAGRQLTNDDLGQLRDALPESSVPGAVESILNSQLDLDEE